MFYLENLCCLRHTAKLFSLYIQMKLNIVLLRAVYWAHFKKKFILPFGADYKIPKHFFCSLRSPQRFQIGVLFSYFQRDYTRFLINAFPILHNFNVVCGYYFFEMFRQPLAQQRMGAAFPKAARRVCVLLFSTALIVFC